MKRHAFLVGLLWVLLTIGGEVLVVTLAPALFPLAVGREAGIVDDAFRILMILAVPVFTFVVAVLGYSILRFRTRGEPAQDGPPVHTHGPLVAGWFVVTAGLTVLMILYPGVTGMGELAARAEEKPDLVVQVKAMRFAWLVTYPEQRVTTLQELVLPVDRHVRFDVTSQDVVHSFWVPAFRVKIDAVPGLVTTAHATPHQTGTFQDDPNLRLQCAELCGVAHDVMAIPVRVVAQSEFDAWVAQHTQGR